MSTLLPSYMSDIWRCYEQMSREHLAQIDLMLVNSSPELCNINVLPFLAWECDADISGLSEVTARKVIRAAFNTMQYAGTIKALKALVEALSDVVKVAEWFEYAGAPYHFRIEIDASTSGLSSELITKLEKTAAKQKNVRSVLESIKISMLSRATLTHALTVKSGEVSTVYPYFPDPIVTSVQQLMSIVFQTADFTTIYPEGA